MGKNFSAIEIGKYFKTKDGETFKKTTELTYDDSIGLEHYIGSELGFDEKIVVPEAPVPVSAPSPAAKPKKTKKTKKTK
jgi:hypothetical protein